jgi:autotransporter-associated beta strand protein
MVSSSPNKQIVASILLHLCVLGAAASILITTQAASAPFTYDGGGTDSNWSTKDNWMNSTPPPAGGGNSVIISFNPNTPNNRTSTNQDLGNPFVLKEISYPAQLFGQAPGFTIDGMPLRFDADQGTPQIESFATGAIQIIKPSIALAKNLTLTGNFDNADNQQAQVQLLGNIGETPQNSGRSITVSMQGTGAYVLSGTNTFSGGVTLQAGRLIIGNNAALGAAAGTFTINGGTVRSATGLNATVPNPLTINGDFQAGEMGIDQSLTFSGPTTVKGVRSISVANPTVIARPPFVAGAPGAPLIFGGAVTTTATDGVKATGAPAGVIGKGTTAQDFLQRQRAGGVLQFNGASPNYRGSLEVASGSVFVNGSLGTKATPVASVTVQSGARLSGSGSISVAPGKLTNRGYVRPGVVMSPGILTISGGIEFTPQSGYSWQFDGPTAGNGDGFYSQLRVADGTVLLDSSGGLMPTLDVDVLEQTLLPVVGQTYAIIDLLDSSIPRVTGDFMDLNGADLFNGATFFDFQGFDWQISYFGGPNDNDVVLTLLSSPVPEPGTLPLILVALAVFGAARRRGKAIKSAAIRHRAELKVGSFVFPDMAIAAG